MKPALWYIGELKILRILTGTMETQNKAELNIEEMAKAGLHFGHRKFRLHPKMKPFVFGIRNSISLIDLEKTAEKMVEALDYIRSLVLEGKTLILVGTKIQTKDSVKKIAEECGLPYVNEKWLRGTFTNFEVIKKRIDYFRSLEQKIVAGELDKYTKKEQVMFGKQLERLRSRLEGIKSIERLPDAIFVLDIAKDAVAVKEARGKNIKVIGIADTSSDPSVIDYAIPANDDAVSSIKYILERMKEVILEAKENRPKAEPVKVEK